MEFNKFCETVAEKLGVKLIPLPTEYEFAHNYIFPVGHRPTYEEYCKRRDTYKNDKYDAYFENFTTDKSHVDFLCDIYDAQTHELFGYVIYNQIFTADGVATNVKPVSSFYNRDDEKQEVYYDGDSVKRAMNALMKRKPVLVW